MKRFEIGKEHMQKKGIAENLWKLGRIFLDENRINWWMFHPVYRAMMTGKALQIEAWNHLCLEYGSIY